MLYDAVLAKKMAAELLERGIYVIGFFYPVVPKGEARIRVQISAAMEIHQLDEAVDAFTEVGQKLNVLTWIFLIEIKFGTSFLCSVYSQAFFIEKQFDK